jgi:hypothetical protein
MGFPQLGQRSELRIFKFCIGTVYSSNPYTIPSLDLLYLLLKIIECILNQ